MNHRDAGAIHAYVHYGTCYMFLYAEEIYMLGVYA